MSNRKKASKKIAKIRNIIEKKIHNDAVKQSKKINNDKYKRKQR